MERQHPVGLDFFACIPMMGHAMHDVHRATYEAYHDVQMDVKGLTRFT